ncbi:MAG: hypothetical protein ABI644_09260 [Arenimonas sp.]
MKNILFAVLFLSLIISIPAGAQPSVNQWRLVKINWQLPGDAADIYEYKYDSAGRVSEIRNLSGKTLKNTEKDFVYDSDNRIKSCSLYIKGNKLYTYEFTYDDEGRLTSRKDITHDVNYGKPDKVTLTRNFRYEDNKIIESKSRSSFGGKLIDETVYEIDDDGNFIRKTGMDLNSKVKAQDYTYGNYDSRLNPLQYTGAYFFTDLESRHAGGDGAWEDTVPATSSFTANKDGLLGKMIIRYTLSDGGTVNHTYAYTYVKLKP